MKLIGVIVFFDGYVCLYGGKAHYPLGGNSGIASDFVEAFGEATKNDIGKRLLRHSAGHLCLDNAETAAATCKRVNDHLAAMAARGFDTTVSKAAYLIAESV